MTTDPLDDAPITHWTDAGQHLLDRARTLAPPNAGVREMSFALRQARVQLPRLARMYDEKHVIERPTARREAGDTLAARAVGRLRTGEFSTISAALHAVMAEDPGLAKTYLSTGDQR